jgi:hypothetical protein
MNANEFNRRTQKAQLSRGWSHKPEHYRFLHHHRSDAPFTEPRSASRTADAIIAVVSIIGLAVLLGIELL